MSSKQGNIIKSEDAVEAWTPEEINEEFVCSFVKIVTGPYQYQSCCTWILEN